MARRVRDWVGFRQTIPSTLRRAPTHIRPPSIRASLARLLFLLPVLTRPALAQEPAAVKDQMRVTLGITRPLGANTLGVSALGVFSNPNKDVHSLYVSPLSVVHKPGKWCELWLGLFCYYNDKSDEDDSVDIRPRVGAKLFLPNAWKWNLYNFTRFEYRFLQDLGSGDDGDFERNDNIWRLNLKLNLGAPSRDRGDSAPAADPH